MSTVKKIFVCLRLCVILVVLLTNTTIAPAQSGRVNGHNVRSTIIAAYKQYFGLDIPFPAYAQSRSATLERSWTSTAYLGSLRYRLYVGADGTVLPFVGEAKRPYGNYRVAVVAIDHGNTNIASLLNNMWVDVQQQINHNYEEYSYSSGCNQPMVQFVNTNFLALSSEIANPRNSEEIISFVEGKGYARGDFDIYMSLDLDPQHQAGGFATYGGNFVYMGYYYLPTAFADLSETSYHKKSQLFWIAKAAYEHEGGHSFGWEHLWTITMGGQYMPDDCITDPALYGWTDTDGDGVPEIMSLTPYGMK